LFNASLKVLTQGVGIVHTRNLDLEVKEKTLSFPTKKVLWPGKKSGKIFAEYKKVLLLHHQKTEQRL